MGMYNSILAQMFHQYLETEQIDLRLWPELYKCFKRETSNSMVVDINNIEITPWSLAAASKSFNSETLDVLLQFPNGSKNLFAITTHKKFCSFSFFDQLVVSANKGQTGTERNTAVYALQYLHSKGLIPGDKKVFIVSPELLPKRLVNWALETRIGILNYYKEYQNAAHNSSVWKEIQSCAQELQALEQNRLLTTELSSFGKNSFRSAKI